MKIMKLLQATQSLETILFLCFCLLGTSQTTFGQVIPAVRVEYPNPADKTDIFPALGVDKQKRLWAGSEGGKLYYRENGIWKNSPVAGVVLGRISDFEFDNKGGMWLGSVNKGIFYRDSTGKWTTLSKAVTGATSDQVFDIQIGFGSTVYIATYIEVLEFDGTTWKRYGKNTVGDKALKGNPIWSIQEDKKGNIWALSSKFLHKIAKDGTWSYIDLDKEIGSSDNYYGFAFDSKNNFMLHNYSGLERGIWNEQLNKYTFAYATNAVGYSYIKGIYDKNDILWLAGEADAKGINWYNGGKKVNLYYKAGETPQEIKSMVIDPLDNNKIWTGDYYAFGVYEITTNTVAAKDMLPLLAELKAYQNNQELLVSWSGIYTKQQISLFDMNGRAIAQTTLNDGEQVTQFTVTDFPSGIYALRLSSKEGEQTIKIAITHK